MDKSKIRMIGKKKIGKKETIQKIRIMAMALFAHLALVFFLATCG